jgi:hypothetical protein
MAKHGKPMWRVIAESSNKKEVRLYNVIADEMEITSRGSRSNEYNVKEACIEKGFNIIGAMFLGYVKQIPKNSIDISNADDEEDTPKKQFKKQFKK